MSAGVLVDAPFVEVERVLGERKFLLDEKLLVAEEGREFLVKLVRQILGALCRLRERRTGREAGSRWARLSRRAA